MTIVAVGGAGRSDFDLKSSVEDLEATVSIRTLATCFAIGSCLVGSPATADDGAASTPRYLLSPGREFAFHTEARTERDGGGTVHFVDWKVWVIGRNSDGSWRLVIRCDLTTKRHPPGVKVERDSVDTLVWSCRMFEDGHLVSATAMGTVRDPFRLFPQLPSTLDERDRGWRSAGPEQEGRTLHHRLTPGTKSDGESLSITTRAEAPQDKVYVSTHEYCATFDGSRGVVTRVETKDSSGYLNSAITRGTIELVGVENRGEEWAVNFGREANRYFDAVEAYDAACKQAVRDEARCKEILTEAKAKLNEARKGLTRPVFQDAVGQKLTGHDRMVGYYAEQAKVLASRLGKAADEWEAEDIEGKTHRLADYRGKVVVMDFWYRGCGWCMEAMPQINRLSETFRKEPVAVLGMSIDEDEKDARVVIDAMELKYPTIKAIGIPEKYGIQSYPTLIVIDKAGKIREIHVGYSLHLYEDLSALIRDLLAENQGTTK